MSIFSGLVGPIASVIDKLVPDKAEAEKLKLKALELEQNGQLAELNAERDILVAQAATNTAEASSDDKFTRRWRPAIGWVCAISLAVQFIVNPLAIWFVALTGIAVTVPNIALGEDLLYLVMGMLGLGGMRSFEKIKGRRK